MVVVTASIPSDTGRHEKDTAIKPVVPRRRITFSLFV